MLPESFRKEIIFIPLLNEALPTIRAAYGLRVGEQTYIVLLSSDYNPEDEEWEFPPGSIVICQKELGQAVYKGQELLVARFLSPVDPGKLKKIVGSEPSEVKFS